jgi:phosphoglycolate phosphatase-like HAD superfamily hydrolase
VLWDVDGTLLNVGEVGGDLYEAVYLQLFGCSLEDFAPMAGHTDRAIVLETLQMAGIGDPRRYVDLFLESLSKQAQSVGDELARCGQALPGAAAAIAALAAARIPRQRGLSPASGTGAWGPPASPGSSGGPGDPGQIRQSVLSGNVRQLAEVKLAAVGLREGLDMCIGAYGDDHEERAELVHVARRRAEAVHGRGPGTFAGVATVVVGDTPLDIEAALSAGARPVGVTTGGYLEADLEAAGADVVLRDLSDTGAVLKALLA